MSSLMTRSSFLHFVKYTQLLLQLQVSTNFSRKVGLRRPTAPVKNYDGNKLAIKHTRSCSLQSVVFIAKSERLN